MAKKTKLEEGVTTLEEATVIPMKKELLDTDLVTIEIPVHVKIAGVRLQPGVHTVQRHQARDIVAIANKKMHADLQALSVTSKSYLVNRALNGAINVKEVDDIKLK
jgi:hypothetical protein